MLHVLSDLLDAFDRGEVAALVLLDLSAAFDTVDHAILFERLRRSLGLTDVVLDWFDSYLSGRKQSVRRGSQSSPPVDVVCGVPQARSSDRCSFYCTSLTLRPSFSVIS